MKSSPAPWLLSVTLWFSLLAPALANPADPKVLHVLNRLSFGPRPGDVQAVESMGVDRYIQQQLNPESIPESAELRSRLAQLDTQSLSPLELKQEYNPSQFRKVRNTSPEAKKAAHQKLSRVINQTLEARLLRATQNPRQLEEVMTDFWFNHFNVYSGKGLTKIWTGAYENQAIRPYALGRFRDLLGATAHHPAMLFYLDNWRSVAPNSGKAKGKNQGLNENYAREIMELHTLGVDGGYSQQDVITLAKILTGWTIQSPKTNKQTAQSTSRYSAWGFFFDPARHDSSDKVFLGQRITGGGEAEGEQALDILAKSPATARHISYQLAQYFVADQPPPALVDRLAQKFLASDGNIREVLNTLFHSSEFWDSRSFNAKFKTPYQYVISSVRATGADLKNPQPLVGTLKELGMPLYGCLTPDGYKNTEDAWLNSDAMTRRLGFATAIASGRLPIFTAALPRNPGSKPGAQLTLAGQPKPRAMTPRNPAPSSSLDATQLANTLGNRFSEKTQSAIASSSPDLRAALILGSPEFMRR